MVTVKKAGATLLPALPAFYHKPKTMLDMVDFIVARVLDVFGIERWEGEKFNKAMEKYQRGINEQTTKKARFLKDILQTDR